MEELLVSLAGPVAALVVAVILALRSHGATRKAYEDVKDELTAVWEVVESMDRKHSPKGEDQ